MIEHELNIKSIIWDDSLNQWGIVELIQGKAEDKVIESDESDCIILYTPCYYDKETDEWIEEMGECECCADMAYPLVPNMEFWYDFVCLEINTDEFDADAECEEDKNNYDYYCPARQENCWKFETIKR